jgi:hypothetical protein
MSEHKVKAAAETVEQAVRRAAWNNKIVESLPPRGQIIAIVYDEDGPGVLAPERTYSETQIIGIQLAVSQWAMAALAERARSRIVRPV